MYARGTAIHYGTKKILTAQLQLGFLLRFALQRKLIQLREPRQQPQQQELPQREPQRLPRERSRQRP